MVQDFVQAVGSLLELPGKSCTCRLYRLKQPALLMVPWLCFLNSCQQAMNKVHNIRMSSYGHGLLMHFLCSSPQMLQIAGIIHQHVHIEVSSGQHLTWDAVLGMHVPTLSLQIAVGSQPPRATIGWSISQRSWWWPKCALCAIKRGLVIR